VVAPRGEIVYRATPNQEELYIVEIDLSLARNKLMTDRNDILQDRRPEFYTFLSRAQG
jgi:beta-ureidopropionase